MRKQVETLLQRNLAGVRARIEAGEDVNVRDRAGRTPLMNAVVANDIQLVEFLLKAGAAIDAQDKAGWTALHFAAQSYSVSMTELLLRSEATVDLADANGNTPLSTAVFESCGRGDVILLLIKAGANPECTNNHGVSPLSLARTIANYDVRQFLE